jgi:hypothetical protein
VRHQRETQTILDNITEKGFTLPLKRAGKHDVEIILTEMAARIE